MVLVCFLLCQLLHFLSLCELRNQRVVVPHVSLGGELPTFEGLAHLTETWCEPNEECLKIPSLAGDGGLATAVLAAILAVRAVVLVQQLVELLGVLAVVAVVVALATAAGRLLGLQIEIVAVNEQIADNLFQN